MNSFLEIALTLGIFLSSFLVLSIEKYWWGGYLTQPHHHLMRHLHSHSWYAAYKAELYTVDNFIRFVIVASAISFFMMISCLELAQAVATVVYSAY